MAQFKYTIITLILIIVLGLPFILRLKHPRMEPYPAILYPSGATLIKTNDNTVSFFSVELSDSTKVYNTEELLNPIPVHFLFEFGETGYGLRKFSSEFKLYKPPITFRRYNRWNIENVEEIKSFWKNRFDSNYFIVKKKMKTFDTDNGNLVNQELISCEIIYLD